MMTCFSFSVIGKPVPQGSKRHLGNGVIVDQAEKRLKPWRSLIYETALNARPDDWRLDGAYAVYYAFFYKRPASHLRKNGDLKPSAPPYCISRSAGDLEKTCRSVSDALTYIAFNDDSQIVQLTATKQYTIEEPHVIVTITNLSYEYG